MAVTVMAVTVMAVMVMAAVTVMAVTVMAVTVMAVMVMAIMVIIMVTVMLIMTVTIITIMGMDTVTIITIIGMATATADGGTVTGTVMASAHAGSGSNLMVTFGTATERRKSGLCGSMGADSRPIKNEPQSACAPAEALGSLTHDRESLAIRV